MGHHNRMAFLYDDVVEENRRLKKVLRKLVDREDITYSREGEERAWTADNRDKAYSFTRDRQVQCVLGQLIETLQDIFGEKKEELTKLHNDLDMPRLMDLLKIINPHVP